MRMNKKSTLKITEQDFVLTIRKKPNLSFCIMEIFVWLCTIALPIWLFYRGNFETLPKKGIFIIIYACAVLGNLSHTVSVFFGRIKVDRLGKEICIYNPFKHQKSFNEITNIRLFFKEDCEGADRHGVIIVLKNSKKIKIETGSKEQAEELEELLKSYIHIETENEDNEDEL